MSRQVGLTEHSSVPGEYAGENEPQIGDVNEGVVEGGEDASNAENELACSMRTLVRLMIAIFKEQIVRRTVTGQGAEGDVLLGSGSLLGGSHCDCGDGVVVDGIWRRRKVRGGWELKIEKVGVCPSGILDGDWL